MKDIAIYGAGGLGREVAWLINNINFLQPKSWNFIGFFDDGIPKNQQIENNWYNIGSIEEINSWEEPLNIVLAFGKPSTIRTIRSKITNPNISFPNLIHPSIIIADENLTIGIGNIICRNCFFSINNKIGSFNLFNGYTATGHDVTIGDFNVIMHETKISGNVNIGNCNRFGSGSFIVQELQIGDNVSLSPMSALLTKPKNGETYIGNPAKRFVF